MFLFIKFLIKNLVFLIYKYYILYLLFIDEKKNKELFKRIYIYMIF